MYLRNILMTFVNIVFAIVLGLLALRFILRAFGANAANGFVEWVYASSAILLAPFRGIFPTTELGGTFTIEFSTLLAMIIYMIIYLIVVELIKFISAPAVAEDVDEQRVHDGHKHIRGH